MKVVFFFLFVTFSYTAFACQPILRILEKNGEESGDDSISWHSYLVVDEPDLPLKGLTNNQTYTCPEGVWMAYRNEHYAGAEGERYILSGNQDGIFQCTFEGDGGREHRVIRSAKVIGDPGDFYASAVVTYTRLNNEGTDTTYLNDTVRTNTTFQSLILMGSQPIELFTDEDFRGASYCVQPNNGDVHNQVEYFTKRNGDELYTNLKDLPAIFDNVEFHSFQFGCSSHINAKF